VPSSVAKIKAAAVELGAFSFNIFAVFATMPVGVEGPVPPFGDGTVTASAGLSPPGDVPSPK
jgi:hypothetical protein